MTMVQVAVHQNMLYELDTKYLIINKTLVVEPKKPTQEEQAATTP